ncbi:MAG: hypothetical protein ABI591_28320 [Kofleriaceae bacterium]
MDDDHNSLGLDLDAWAPPAVAPNFADRVIARVVATDQAIAVEINRRSTRRWWYGTAIAAILAAAAAIIVWQMPGQPEPRSAPSGTIVAVRPQRLVLDHATGDLDVGANVTWDHVGGAVTVTQRAGAATWHVDAKQHLTISVGSKTLPETLIDATDATLRVEANMNLADAKSLGATAVTAAALITLIVYEGRVKTTSEDGQSVVVAAGDVLAFRVDKHSIVITNDVGGGTVDKQVIHKTAKPAVHVPDKLDASAVRITMEGAREAFAKCQFKAKVRLTFTIEPSGKVTHITSTSTDRLGEACVTGVLTDVAFPEAKTGSTVTYPLEPCDVETLIDTGTEAEGRGDHTHALDAFERAYACKKDTHTVALTFMAACNARKLDAARRVWKAMKPDTQDHLFQICLHNHITREILDAP